MKSEVHIFSDGRVHSLRGPLANDCSRIKNEQDLIEYAKREELTIKFGR